MTKGAKIESAIIVKPARDTTVISANKGKGEGRFSANA